MQWFKAVVTLLFLLNVFALEKEGAEELYQRAMKTAPLPLDYDFDGNFNKITGSAARSALADLLEASQLGHQAAASRLGEIYFFGLGRYLEPDYGKAAEYLSQGRSPRALYLLSLLASNGLGGQKREMARVLVQLRLAAAAGLPEANAALGFRHTNGIGLTRNCHRGRDYYFRAALPVARQHRLDPTLGHLGRPHRLIDDPKAVRGQADMIDFYQYSADNGDPNSQYVLGQIHLLGIGGTTRDHPLAAQYFERAVEGNHGGACGYLGLQYHYGFGVRQDYRKAFQYYSRGSKLRNAMSQNGLGMLYWRGQEVVKDLEEAEKYFRLASDDGFGEASFNLAQLLHEKDSRKHEDAVYTLILQSLRQGYLPSYMEMARHNMKSDLSCSLAAYVLRNLCERSPQSILMDHAFLEYHAGRVRSALSIYLYFAEQGHDVALFNAAYIFERERNRESRKRALVLWARSAAFNANTNYLARIKVGDAFFDGIGTENDQPDYVMAAANYYMAIEQKSCQASFNLAYMYDRGIGITKDQNLALRYYNLAQVYSNGTMPEAWLPIGIASFHLRLHQRLRRSMQRIWRFRSLPPWVHVLVSSMAIGLAALLITILFLNRNRNRTVAVAVTAAAAQRADVHHEHQD